MVETSSNIRNCSSLEPVVGLCESLDSYCWTRLCYMYLGSQSPTTGVSAPTIPDIGLRVNHQLYSIGLGVNH